MEDAGVINRAFAQNNFFSVAVVKHRVVEGAHDQLPA